ncbi:hypothetical protein [Paenibacillus sp. sgz302251]|uniref:hypothetical protein n=1 Tax=Paenibacillus sp. sgz302251 TaxID=3414493 RepID=UPI003C7E754C
MFELELHDLIPYLFSISLLYTLAYAYASHRNTEEYAYWERSQTDHMMIIVLPRLLIRTIPIHQWLVRKGRRKESPDDDITDCMASFVDVLPNKRGGFKCRRTMYSFHLKINV